MKPIKYQSNSVGKTIDAFFDNFFNGNIGDFVGSDFFLTTPSTNIREDANGFYLELAAPGLSKEAFQLQLDQDLLTIEVVNADSEKVNNKKFLRREFNYSAFKRTFTLPDTVNAEKIDASYDKGVLLVNLPKKEAAKPLPTRVIKIN